MRHKHPSHGRGPKQRSAGEQACSFHSCVRKGAACFVLETIKTSFQVKWPSAHLPADASAGFLVRWLSQHNQVHCSQFLCWWAKQCLEKDWSKQFKKKHTYLCPWREREMAYFEIFIIPNHSTLLTGAPVIWPTSDAVCTLWKHLCVE